MDGSGVDGDPVHCTWMTGRCPTNGRQWRGWMRNEEEKRPRDEWESLASGMVDHNAGPVKQGEKQRESVPLVVDAQAPMHASSVVKTLRWRDKGPLV